MICLRYQLCRLQLENYILRTLYDKMTRKMLWWLVVPTSFLIAALVILIGFYTHIIFKSEKISVNLYGIEVVINQTDDIMRKIDETILNTNIIIKKLAAKCHKSIYSTPIFLKHHGKKSTEGTQALSKENIIEMIPEASSNIKELESLREQINEQRSNLLKLKNAISQSNRK